MRGVNDNPWESRIRSHANRDDDDDDEADTGNLSNDGLQASRMYQARNTLNSRSNTEESDDGDDDDTETITFFPTTTTATLRTTPVNPLFSSLPTSSVFLPPPSASNPGIPIVVPNDDGVSTIMSWREREGQQRSLRAMLMLLLMLLLMNGEEPRSHDSSFQKNAHPLYRAHQAQQRQQLHGRLRGTKIKDGMGYYSQPPSSSEGSSYTLSHNSIETGGVLSSLSPQLSPEVYLSRRTQDARIRRVVQVDRRYRNLVDKYNNGRDYDSLVRQWAAARADHEQDQFFASPISATAASSSQGNAWQRDNVIRSSVRTAAAAAAAVDDDSDEEFALKTAFHYPWNATGLYRGRWTRAVVREDFISTSSPTNDTAHINSTSESSSPAPTFHSLHKRQATKAATSQNATRNETDWQYFDAVSLEGSILRMVKQQRKEIRLLQKQNDGSLKPKQSLKSVLQTMSSPSTRSSLVSSMKSNSLETTVSHADHPLMWIPMDPPKIGIFLLPEKYRLRLRNDHNLTSMGWNEVTVKAHGRLYEVVNLPPPAAVPYLIPTSSIFSEAAISSSPQQVPTRSEMSSNDDVPEDVRSKITLQTNHGRVALQLYSRGIPAITELSLVDGFIKLYDSVRLGYSTRHDLVLRVRGVLIHATGQLSLVANDRAAHRSALVIDDSDDTQSNVDEFNRTGASYPSSERDRKKVEEINDQHRRLSKAVSELVATSIGTSTLIPKSENHHILSSSGGNLLDSIRDEAWNLVHQTMAQYKVDGSEKGEKNIGNQSADITFFRSSLEIEADVVAESNKTRLQRKHRVLESHGAEFVHSMFLETNVSDSLLDTPWSDIVIPYPYVRDDDDESVRFIKTPASRKMLPREQLLELNAADCEFEIRLEIEPTQWTVGEWRTLLGRRFEQVKELDPANHKLNDPEGNQKFDKKPHRVESFVFPSSSRTTRSTYKYAPQVEALVQSASGTIVSHNCDFHAFMNATAPRTDWGAITRKAINYSFLIMLVCLAQIMILLRQLVHSQAQSVATRVSLLSIGWQTVIDALMCFAHIYLSLAVQKLFTAFASVAFFKLLIFCVIEMKYMAILTQARGRANGNPPSPEVLRRRIAMLHARFYLAMTGVLLLALYVNDKWRILYVLGVYSFWVPQIVLNIITEARNPLHPHFIYGMSFTRLVAPLYFFGFQANFLKEVYPDTVTDWALCRWLVVWVAVQTALLLGQAKFGARFMIPARFSPPKFDYSRPIPSSMLPPGVTQDLKPPSSSVGVESTTADSVHSRHTTAVTTRNRRGNNGTGATDRGITASGTKSSTANIPSSSTSLSNTPQVSVNCLECSICYDPIDVCDRKAYMLAPCNHLFHRDCLVTWMEVKMECPICRKELPAI
jgi:hypothetical protein